MQGWIRHTTIALVAGAALLAGAPAQAQRGQGPATPQAAAPTDLTGYWVSVVTEDWRFRMVTAPIGDTASIPVSDAGQAAADAWDPAADVQNGLECRAYGAGGIMRMPTRLRISWADANTLMIETDAGEQVRRLHFDGEGPGGMAPDWQGYSAAEWEGFNEGQGQAGGGRGGGGQLSGSLLVTTTNMRPGYVRRNGVPYSGDAVMRESFDVVRWPNGEDWLIVETILDDPEFLNQPMYVSSHFKKEPDGSKWDPQPCRVVLPLQ